MFRSLLILLALSSGPRLLLATGIEEPSRWLGLGSTIAIDAPEFFFEFETKRIGDDLHSAFKANIPSGYGFDRDYSKQTNAVDVADFEEALKTGAIHPPDPEKA